MGKGTIRKAQSYVRRGNRRRTQRLLAKHPELKESEDAMLIFTAIWFRRDMVRWLLDQGLNPDVRMGAGDNTPLMQAAGDGDTELMGWLLEYGANLKAVNDASENALGFAVTWQQPEAVRYLVAAGVDVNDLADSGPERTQLDIAEQSGWPEVAQTLRECGGQRFADLLPRTEVSHSE